MKKSWRRRAAVLPRLGGLVLVLGLTLTLVTWAQPPPPANGNLIRDANEVIEEINLALTQTLFAWTQINLGGGGDARDLIHEVINIIEGPDGDNFDPQYGRPSGGQGEGALPAAARLLGGIRQIESMPGSSDYVIAGENIVQFLELAVERALIALNELEGNLERASEELKLMQGLMMAARGSVEEKDRPTEGGARTIKAWLEDSNN